VAVPRLEDREGEQESQLEIGLHLQSGPDLGQELMEEGTSFIGVVQQMMRISEPVAGICGLDGLPGSGECFICSRRIG